MINRDSVNKEELSQNQQSEENNFEQWYRFIKDHGFAWK